MLNLIVFSVLGFLFLGLISILIVLAVCEGEDRYEDFFRK